MLERIQKIVAATDPFYEKSRKALRRWRIYEHVNEDLIEMEA